MSELQMKINFLTYVPRSGSTMVARLLSENSNVVVVPELALFRDLLTFDDGKLERMSADDLAALLASDRQFVGLGLAEIGMADVMANSADRGRAGVIESIVAAYGAHVDAAGSTYLLKVGDALNYRSEIRSLWPHSKFINIQRDPRAVANSLLKTNRAYTPGESMGRNDPYHCALAWARHFDAVAKMDHRELLTIRYEDVIVGPEARSAEIATFLASANGPTNPRTPFRVAAMETGIHPIYDAPPDPNRVAAWETELSRSAQLVVESLLTSRMRRAEYEPIVLTGASTGERVVALAGGYAKHLVATSRWAFSRVWEARGDLRVLEARIKNVIRRRVQR